MKPTMHLRWHQWRDYEKHGDFIMPVNKCDLEQFWEIAEDESDITLPRETGPGGEIGRWRAVPTYQPLSTNSCPEKP